MSTYEGHLVATGLKFAAVISRFNVDDVRERANLRDRSPAVWQRLRQQWEDWNSQQLPMTDVMYSSSVSPETMSMATKATIICQRYGLRNPNSRLIMCLSNTLPFESSPLEKLSSAPRRSSAPARLCRPSGGLDRVSNGSL